MKTKNASRRMKVVFIEKEHMKLMKRYIVNGITEYVNKFNVDVNKIKLRSA